MDSSDDTDELEGHDAMLTPVQVGPGQIIETQTEIVSGEIATSWITPGGVGHSIRAIYRFLLRDGRLRTRGDGSIALERGAVYIASTTETASGPVLTRAGTSAPSVQAPAPMLAAAIDFSGPGTDPTTPWTSIWYPILVHGPVQVGSAGTHWVVRTAEPRRLQAAIVEPIGTSRVVAAEAPAGGSPAPLATLEGSECFVELDAQDPMPTPPLPLVGDLAALVASLKQSALAAGLRVAP